MTLTKEHCPKLADIEAGLSSAAPESQTAVEQFAGMATLPDGTPRTHNRIDRKLAQKSVTMSTPLFGFGLTITVLGVFTSAHGQLIPRSFVIDVVTDSRRCHTRIGMIPRPGQVKSRR
jgi:hypothetical protein